MIICFPDLDTLRLAVTSAAVPPDVTATAADVVLADDGRVFLDTAVKLPKKAAGELAKLSVTQSKSMPGKPQRVSCWLQVVPVQKNPIPPQPTPQQAVLFELPSAKDLPGMVAEMLRLGNDRQSFRWVASAADATDRRVLLRVIGPPYYTLLRAIDAISTGKSEPVRAYTEQAPRVWVELGYTHPFADRVALPADKMLLVRHPREWAFLPEQPYQDVYDILKFDLPNPPVEWKAIDQRSKLAVPLSLVPGNAADTPELWVLRGDALDKLDEFVRESDDRTTQRLRFAVADAANGDRVVVLKVSGTRGSPPTVPLANAVGYRPHPSLPHLFIPVAARLHPQLRRDAVRQLLADDPDLVVWLHPTGGGQFVPESVPDSAFHPLEDWVDYVIESAHTPLKEWIESVKFDFAHFVCGDDRQPKPKDPGKGPKVKGDGDTRPLTPEKEAGKGGSRKAGPGEQPTAERFEAAAEPVRKPNEWKVRREELQKRFLAVDGPLDHPDRVALWPKLATANAGAGDQHEAALCWVNAVWEKADADALRQWCRTEFPDTDGEITEAEFGRHLKQSDPPRGEVRRFAAAVCLLASLPKPPTWFAAKLTDVQKFVEGNEPKLPVRTAWLTASTLGVVSGADVLGLARMRDRLLQRLLERGLNPELDLPFFLRTAGLNDSERVRHVRDEAHALHHLVRAWAEAGAKVGAVATPVEGNPTAAYTDLLFAYGLAKLGETQAAAKLADAAKGVLDKISAESDKGIAARFLYRAFRYRIDQAVNGQPTTGRLPADMYAELADIECRAQGAVNSPFGMAHFVVSRMREQSRVLELFEKEDPYSKYKAGHEGELAKELYKLRAETDPVKLMNRVREQYRLHGRKADPKERGKPAGVTDDQLHILVETLPLSYRAGGEFATEMVRLVQAALRHSFPQVAELSKKLGRLLERGLFLAGHYDQRELVTALVDAFGDVLAAATSDDRRFELIDAVSGQGLKSLRKLGLRDDIDRLLQKLHTAVLGGRSLSELKATHASRPDLWLKALTALQSIAGGWLAFGLTDKARPLLAEAEAELLAPPGPKPPIQDNARLATAYVAAVGQGDAEAGVKRIKAVFRDIRPGKVTNAFTTAPFYSRLHLNVAEAVVLTLASDDFTLGAAGRRWLEDDEFLVRRRIHRDMRAQLTDL